MTRTDCQTIRRCLERHSPRRLPDNHAREAAVAAILVDSAGGDPDILLIKRAERPDDPWSGQMALPGGRRDPEDGSLLETACRETLEETGVQLGADNVLGELDDIRPMGQGLPRITVRPFVFQLGALPSVVTNEEVDLHLWIRLSDLPSLAGSRTVPIDGRNVAVPAFQVGPHIVWGLTERILKSFIDLCG